ncbi:MAG: hypothetical protein V1830_00755, partial [Candidatus Omnitrophota bacterium]
NPRILKVITAWPGLKKPKSAGIAIKSENKGIKIQVLFKKNPRRIREQDVNKRHIAYKHSKTRIFLASSTWMINNNTVIAFTLGSRDWKNPFWLAYWSAKIISFKKDRALIIERSIKLLLFNPT